jgi:SAM-dependent methyltransferase
VGVKGGKESALARAPGSPRDAAGRRAATPAEVVWHDVECGAYRADLALWRELAAGAGDPILDVGAGTGRVALALARAGHAVTALDRAPVLLDALRERARGLPVQAVQGDACSFALARADYGLCIVPMQTIQLLGGPESRAKFLRLARAHLRPGGTLACAILGELDCFDCSDGTIGPSADRATCDGLLYLSRAIRVAETPRGVVIERERRVLAEHAPAPRWPFPAEGGAPEGAAERDVIELDRVTVAQLRSEGAEAGFEPLATRELAATDEHIGSSVVVLGA